MDMGTHMKTTIEIADGLLREAKAVAAREGTTIRALLDEGLRLALKRRRAQPRFVLRKATFKGRGLRPELAGAPWNRFRELAYEERGA